MAELMEEVLLLARFDAGKMEFKPEPIDLAGFCRRVAAEVSAATHRRCPIQFAAAPLSGEASADERLLEHILLNLLNNAVKYSETGQPVEFSVRREGTGAVCTIQDHGIGIPAPDREWLFKAFHRGRNVGERPGTGLGLVVVQRCVERHGGRVEVASEVGHGTTVTVWLPLFSSKGQET
jgi:signal transduction histidine kinase